MTGYFSQFVRYNLSFPFRKTLWPAPEFLLLGGGGEKPKCPWSTFKITAFACLNTPVFKLQLAPNTLKNLRHRRHCEPVELITVYVWKSWVCIAMSVLLLLPFLMEVGHRLSRLSLSQPLFPLTETEPLEPRACHRTVYSPPSTPKSTNTSHQSCMPLFRPLQTHRRLLTQRDTLLPLDGIERVKRAEVRETSADCLLSFLCGVSLS